jgi:hypothetical protein
LSSTLRCSRRKNCWKTKPRWVARTSDSCASESAEVSVPAIRTVPLVGRSSVPRMLSSVDLPAPDSPVMATDSPDSTTRSMASRAVTAVGGG